MAEQAKYRIGQTVHHKKQGYRGIIVDVDPSFHPQPFMDAVSAKREIAAGEAWYRVLVDESSHTSYVKETLLDKDLSDLPIDNPQLCYFLNKNKEGKYHANFLMN